MLVGNFIAFYSWWYGDGFNGRLKAFAERLARVNDFFSVGLLARTLFSPFRQLTDAHVKGSLEVHLRAFFDDVVSRLIGAAVRSVMIVASFFAAAAVIIYGAFTLLLWLLAPLLPVLGVVGTVIEMML